MGFGKPLVVQQSGSCLEVQEESRQSFAKRILFVREQRCMIVCGSTLLDTMSGIAYHGTRKGMR